MPSYSANRPPTREQHDRDDERVDVAFPPVPERVLLGGLAPGPLAAEQQQALVAGVGDRVDRLGQHRRRAGQHERGELGHRDAEVRRRARRRSPGYRQLALIGG